MDAFRLAGIYPNPFNPAATIRFALANPGPVEIVLFNLAGQRIRMIRKSFVSPGTHEIIWDGRDDLERPLPSGVYVVRIMADGKRVTGKLTLIK